MVAGENGSEDTWGKTVARATARHREPGYRVRAESSHERVIVPHDGSAEATKKIRRKMKRQQSQQWVFKLCERVQL